jgi:hypothetical protein
MGPFRTLAIHILNPDSPAKRLSAVGAVQQQAAYWTSPVSGIACQVLLASRVMNNEHRLAATIGPTSQKKTRQRGETTNRAKASCIRWIEQTLAPRARARKVS